MFSRHRQSWPDCPVDLDSSTLAAQGHQQGASITQMRSADLIQTIGTSGTDAKLNSKYVDASFFPYLQETRPREGCAPARETPCPRHECGASGRNRQLEKYRQGSLIFSPEKANSLRRSPREVSPATSVRTDSGQTSSEGHPYPGARRARPGTGTTSPRSQ